MYCGTVPHAYCSLYSISLLHRLFDLYCCYNPFPFLYIVFDQLTTKAVALLLILGQFLPSSSLILLPLLLCRHQLPLWPWLCRTAPPPPMCISHGGSSRRVFGRLFAFFVIFFLCFPCFLRFIVFYIFYCK